MNGNRYVIEQRYVIFDSLGGTKGFFEDFQSAIEYVEVLEEEDKKNG